MLLCPRCGYQAQDGKKFCRKCGSPLNAALLPDQVQLQEATPRFRSLRTRPVLWLLLLGSLVAWALADKTPRTGQPPSPQPLAYSLDWTADNRWNAAGKPIQVRCPGAPEQDQGVLRLSMFGQRVGGTLCGLAIQGTLVNQHLTWHFVSYGPPLQTWEASMTRDHGLSDGTTRQEGWPILHWQGQRLRGSASDF
jgi:zinc-ribbon domain